MTNGTEETYTGGVGWIRGAGRQCIAPKEFDGGPVHLATGRAATLIAVAEKTETWIGGGGGSGSRYKLGKAADLASFGLWKSVAE